MSQSARLGIRKAMHAVCLQSEGGGDYATRIKKAPYTRMRLWLAILEDAMQLVSEQTVVQMAISHANCLRTLQSFPTTHHLLAMADSAAV